MNKKLNMYAVERQPRFYKDGRPMRISDYLSSGAAAELLGITKTTLNNWDKKGKLIAYRNPITGFKLYRLIDLHNLLKELNESGEPHKRRFGHRSEPL